MELVKDIEKETKNAVEVNHINSCAYCKSIVKKNCRYKNDLLSSKIKWNVYSSIANHYYFLKYFLKDEALDYFSDIHENLLKLAHKIKYFKNKENSRFLQPYELHEIAKNYWFLPMRNK